jgi:hypothetical protein
MIGPSPISRTAVAVAWSGLLIAMPGPLYAAAAGHTARPVQRGIMFRPGRTTIIRGVVVDVPRAALVAGVAAAVCAAGGLRRTGTDR